MHFKCKVHEDIVQRNCFAICVFLAKSVYSIQTQFSYKLYSMICSIQSNTKIRIHYMIPRNCSPQHINTTIHHRTSNEITIQRQSRGLRSMVFSTHLWRQTSRCSTASCASSGRCHRWYINWSTGLRDVILHASR